MKIDLKALQLDELRMEFPTDQISMKHVRERQHVLCSTERLRGIGATELHAIRAHEIELLIAEAAFRFALGLPDRELPADLRTMSRELNNIYEEYKISAGWHQTEELIRAIEHSAASQAERYRPQRR